MNILNTEDMIKNHDDDDCSNSSSHEQKIIQLKFLEQRKIFLWGPVNDESAKDIVSKLLYLDSEGKNKKITFFIHSPGGAVSAGMSIVDTMNLIGSPVSTVCMGLAASMGAILLSAGKKGERYIYPYGEVMIHQPSIGHVQGVATDIEIQSKQMQKVRKISAELLSRNTGQKVDKILRDFDRDYWMNAEESIKYGIVDALYTG